MNKFQKKIKEIENLKVKRIIINSKSKNKINTIDSKNFGKSS